MKAKIIMAAAILSAALTGCGASETSPEPAPDTAALTEEVTDVPEEVTEVSETETETVTTTAAESTAAETTAEAAAISETEITEAEAASTETSAAAMETTATAAPSETAAPPEITAVTAAAAVKAEKVAGWDENALFHCGLLPVEVNGLCGYINGSGELAIAAQFEKARPFDEYGYARVETGGKTGWIDTSGKLLGIMDFNWGEIGSFSDNGLAPVWGIYYPEDLPEPGVIAPIAPNDGYVDHTGKLVISGIEIPGSLLDYNFNDGTFSENGLAPAGIDGKYGYIDSTGKFIIEPQFDLASKFDSYGMARIEMNGKHGFIDSTGKIVIEPQYDYAEHFYSNNVTGVNLGDRYFIINRKGEITAEDIDYAIEGAGDRFEFPDYDLKVVGNGEYKDFSARKYGYIDSTGKVVIEPQFDNAWEFASNGTAPVLVGDKWGYIIRTGEFLMKPQFDRAYEFDENGIASVTLNGSDMYIDMGGNIVEYSLDTGYSDGYRIVDHTIINANGVNILPEGYCPLNDIGMRFWLDMSMYD